MRFSLILFSITFQTVFCAVAGFTSSYNENREMIYIGTFSENGSEGIYVYDYDRQTKTYNLLQTIISEESPSFLAVSPKGNYLFSANRGSLQGHENWGSVTSFAIDQKTGKLSIIHSQYSFGDSPCHISVHPSGRYLFLSHYQGGNFVVLPIDEEGKIGKPTSIIQMEGKGTIMPRQEKPHTHSAIPSPDGEFVYVSDLGLDKILIYRFDENTGQATPAEQAFIRTLPGAGPRHFTFHPKREIAFSAEELSSTICSYHVNNKTGELTLIQRLSSLPPTFFGDNSSADIHTSPDGKYVYISNRGYNGLGMYRVSATGKMKNIGFTPTIGRRPRNFMPDPKGEFMLVGNRDSNQINIFSIEKDGTLSDTGGYIPVPSPVCIIYLEIG